MKETVGVPAHKEYMDNREVCGDNKVVQVDMVSRKITVNITEATEDMDNSRADMVDMANMAEIVDSRVVLVDTAVTDRVAIENRAVMDNRVDKAVTGATREADTDNRVVMDNRARKVATGAARVVTADKAATGATRAAAGDKARAGRATRVAMDNNTKKIMASAITNRTTMMTMVNPVCRACREGMAKKKIMTTITI